MGIISYVGSFFVAPPPSQKFAERFVLVTECDSGIGILIAKALHRRGYFVFAGFANETAFKDCIEIYRGVPKFSPILLDLTKEQSIEKCARIVTGETKEKGLFALINNTGCNEGFAFEFTSAERIEKTMEVNFMGPIKIIKALLPNLRQNIKYNMTKPSKEQDISPRIINMTSVLGRTTLPFYGAFSASKHALEAMLDTIRIELLPWKIHITMIEPGPTKLRPDLVEIPETPKKNPSDALTIYGEDYVQKAIEFWQKINFDQDSPKEIVRTIVEAVEVGFPKDRYVVGTIAKFQVLMHNVLPRWVIDLTWGSVIRLVGIWPKEVRELEDGITSVTSDNASASSASSASSSAPPSTTSK